MGDRHDREGLVLLDRLPQPEARRAAFRRGLASLALAARERQPVPLEGLDPAALLEAVRTAAADGLLDDLDWLSPASAAVALYEIANALPLGPERRELGRRVVHQLYEGSAETFVAVATSLALGTRRGPRGRAVRARLALALELDRAEAPGVEDLALSLISRSDLAREWLHGPARGNLPARRCAATLLERAALAATRLSAQGDETALRVFELDEIATLLRRLLEDRAPRVSAAAARARGILGVALGDLAAETRLDLDPSRDPATIRRGAISAAAAIAVDPSATRGVLELLRGPLVKSVPSIAGAIAQGLRRAIELEPEAGRLILVEVARRGGLEAFDALVDLGLASAGAAPLVEPLAIARERVLESIETRATDAGLIAWLESLERDLAPRDERGAPNLRERVRGALQVFARKGAIAAHEEAIAIVSRIYERLDELERVDDGSAEGRRRAFHLVRDLDGGLLEVGIFGELLALRARPEDDADGDAPIDQWLDRIASWLGAREDHPTGQDADAVLHAAQLRALVHLADLDGGDGPDGTDRTRSRRLRTLSMLLSRARGDRGRDRPALLDALSRAGDSVVRDEGSEVCDVLVAIAKDLDDPKEIAIVAEGSVVTELRNALELYAELLRASRRVTTTGEVHAFLDHLLAKTRELPSASSPRLEAFRIALQRFARAASGVVSAGGLDDLRDDPQESPLARVGDAVQTIAQLVDGARRRRGEHLERPVPSCLAAIGRLDTALARTGEVRDPDLDQALEACVASFVEELPSAIAKVACSVVRHAAALPEGGPRSVDVSGSIPAIPVRETPLPSWVPPRRILGAYYVLHPLGVGGASSVFVAKRLEERFDPEAPRFALKVPAYSGDVARTLSEEDFLQMFREEAGALLALPPHANLARFVTFDSGARPKPILVMEYVEGPTLSRILERGRISVEEAFGVLDGIAAGLVAMHGAEIGHLDLKPSNVILRRRADAPALPVLVDFGLAGRKVRPGCATLEYGAPEVWGIAPTGAPMRPMPTDVYAFGALAYEVLTGRTLFRGRDEGAVIVAHGLHDGEPEGIARLRTARALRGLADVLAAALRRDPRDRVTIGELREGLSVVGRDLRAQPWPLRGERPAPAASRA
jgi:hypothetical protein